MSFLVAQPGMAPHRGPEHRGVVSDAAGRTAGTDSPVAEEAALNDLHDEIRSLSLRHVGVEPMPGGEAMSGLLLPVVPFRPPSLRDVLLPLPFAFVGVCLAAGQALGMFPPGESVVKTRPGLVGTLFRAGLERSAPFPSTSRAKWTHGWGRTGMGAKPLWSRSSGMALHP